MTGALSGTITAFLNINALGRSLPSQNGLKIAHSTVETTARLGSKNAMSNCVEFRPKSNLHKNHQWMSAS
jgi:hypothetical protein